MTKVQKKFSAEFKAKVALAALQNQMTVAEIIERFGVSKTMIYKWKAEAQANLATVFGKQEQAKGTQRELDNLNRKIGDRHGAGFCKAGIRSIGDSDARKKLVSPDSKLSQNKQLEVLGLSKGDCYYKPSAQKPDEAPMREAIDREHTEHPAMGVRQMRALLCCLGFAVGCKRVRRMMRQMAIHAFYPEPNLSRLGQAKHVRPYLLRHMKVEAPGQVWSTDIAYIKMGRGFLYLYAIIDVYSRHIVGWGLYSTLEASNALEVLRHAVARHGAPGIINSDQGSQYTCEQWLQTVEAMGIKVSMDGRGRCRDNAWIERFWRTLKTEYVYLNPLDNATDLRAGIAGYISYYNERRPHSSLGDVTPKVKLSKISKPAA